MGEVQRLLSELEGHAEVEGPNTHLKLPAHAQVLVLRAKGQPRAEDASRALEGKGARVVRARQSQIEQAAPLHVLMRHPVRPLIAQIHNVLPVFSVQAPNAIRPKLLETYVHRSVHHALFTVFLQLDPLGLGKGGLAHVRQTLLEVLRALSCPALHKRAC